MDRGYSKSGRGCEFGQSGLAAGDLRHQPVLPISQFVQMRSFPDVILRRRGFRLAYHVGSRLGARCGKSTIKAKVTGVGRL